MKSTRLTMITRAKNPINLKKILKMAKMKMKPKNQLVLLLSKKMMRKMKLQLYHLDLDLWNKNPLLKSRCQRNLLLWISRKSQLRMRKMKNHKMWKILSKSQCQSKKNRQILLQLFPSWPQNKRKNRFYLKLLRSRANQFKKHNQRSHSWQPSKMNLKSQTMKRNQPQVVDLHSYSKIVLLLLNLHQVVLHFWVSHNKILKHKNKKRHLRKNLLLHLCSSPKTMITHKTRQKMRKVSPHLGFHSCENWINLEIYIKQIKNYYKICFSFL